MYASVNVLCSLHGQRRLSSASLIKQRDENLLQVTKMVEVLHEMQITAGRVVLTNP